MRLRVLVNSRTTGRLKAVRGGPERPAQAEGLPHQRAACGLLRNTAKTRHLDTIVEMADKNVRATDGKYPMYRVPLRTL